MEQETWILTTTAPTFLVGLILGAVLLFLVNKHRGRAKPEPGTAVERSMLHVREAMKHDVVSGVEIPRRTELDPGVKRLFDLVRECRSELHEEGLITDEEYSKLCDSRSSVYALNSYTQCVAAHRWIETKCNHLKDELAAARALVNLDKRHPELVRNDVRELKPRVMSYIEEHKANHPRATALMQEVWACVEDLTKDSLRLDYLFDQIRAKGITWLKDIAWTNPAETDPMAEPDCILDRATIDRELTKDLNAGDAAD